VSGFGQDHQFEPAVRPPWHQRRSKRASVAFGVLLFAMLLALLLLGRELASSKFIYVDF
jgi:hypothetical protein